MSHRGGLAFYVTSHGFGHLNRSVAVINRIPLDVPVTIRSDPSLFDHWGERLKRPATLEPHSSDVGAINPPGDSAATDGPATLARAAEVHARAMARVDDEADRLRDEGTAALLCDATPVPLVAARRAGIPGFLLANFTWADIYHPHARKLGPEALPTVREIRAAYRQATTLFRAEPALRMAGVAPTIEVGMVVTPGVQPPGRAPGQARPARLGQAGLLLHRPVRPGEPGLGAAGRLEGRPLRRVPPAPERPAAEPPRRPRDRVDRRRPRGLGRRDRRQGRLRHRLRGDGRRIPLIYPPRTGFAEHRVLDRALRPGAAGSRRRPATSPTCGSSGTRAGLCHAARPAALSGRRGGQVAGHLLEAIGHR